MRSADADERILAGLADVDVINNRDGSRAPATEAPMATLAAPLQLTMPEFENLRLSYLGVYTDADERLVTVIELLSPANKGFGPDRTHYLRKRQRLLDARVNFVEIDLLRGGPRLEPVDEIACDYYALVSRPKRRPNADVWPLKLRDVLPPIPTPLATGDREVELDLQAVLQRVYDEAGYAHRIYRNKLVPRLTPANVAWCQEVLAAAGITAPA